MVIKETEKMDSTREVDSTKHIHQTSAKAKDADASRRELQKKILLRRASLTGREYSFLTKLAEDGGSGEVQMAKDKLDDSDLFFDPGEDATAPKKTSVKFDESQAGVVEEEKESTPSRKNGLRKGLERHRSQKSLSFLAKRMNDKVHDKLWKAHEHGISLSRRNLTSAPSRRKLSVESEEPRSATAKAMTHAANQNQNDIFRPDDNDSKRRSVSFCHSVKEGSASDLANLLARDIAAAPPTAATLDDMKSDTSTSSSVPPIAHASHLRHSESILSSVSLLSDLGLSTKSLVSLRSTSDQSEISNSLPKKPRPVVYRQASVNMYGGEGIEVEPAANAENGLEDIGNSSKRSSLDDSFLWKKASSRRLLPSSFQQSRDDMDIMLMVSGSVDSDASLCDNISPSNSWDATQDSQRYNSWDVLKDEYATDYGVGGSLPFYILGTSVEDESAKPHVLSPPLMESLKSFLPYSVAEDNFWLKFSLVRDGASLHSLLQNVRGASHTILAIETADGEVFGSFTSKPWRKQPDYFGTGEAFLWKMSENRNTRCNSIIDQAQLESNIEVFPWSGKNYSVQYCPHNRIALGGGGVDESSKDASNSSITSGFGIAVDSDLLMGTTSPCATFNNPQLALCSDDGVFEVVNLEIWALTPCINDEEAEKNEFSRLFFEKARQ